MTEIKITIKNFNNNRSSCTMCTDLSSDLKKNLQNCKKHPDQEIDLADLSYIDNITQGTRQ